MSDLKEKAQEIWEKFLDLAYDYWTYMLAGAIFIICAIVMVVNASTASAIDKEIDEVYAQIAPLEKEVADAKNESDEDYVERVKVQSRNAKAIGGELIKAQKALAEQYLVMATSHTDEIIKNADEAKVTMEKYSDAGYSQNDLWLLNRNWNLNLESVLDYNGDPMPVLFTMTNSKKELMGFVRGSYNIDQEKVTNVKVQFTNAGIADFETVTGDGGGH